MGEKITGKCIPCKIIFTTKQVDDKCPICGLKLTESDEMETTSGIVVDVMEKKNKNDELFWKAKIDGKVFNFNKKPDTDTNIEVKYNKTEWEGEDGKHESRWVQDFKVVEGGNVGQEMRNAQSPFQPASVVKGEALDPQMLMKKCMIEAWEITQEMNELTDAEIKWTSEDIQKIGVTLFLTRARR